MSVMTPREIVHELDKHIVGQQDAKRAVAIALRNRWRRMQLSDDLRSENHPQEYPDDWPHRGRPKRKLLAVWPNSPTLPLLKWKPPSSLKSGMWAGM